MGGHSHGRASSRARAAHAIARRRRAACVLGAGVDARPIAARSRRCHARKAVGAAIGYRQGVILPFRRAAA
jgi:hypothetical protein